MFWFPQTILAERSQYRRWSNRGISAPLRNLLKAELFYDVPPAKGLLIRLLPRLVGVLFCRASPGTELARLRGWRCRPVEPPSTLFAVLPPFSHGLSLTLWERSPPSLPHRL